MTRLPDTSYLAFPFRVTTNGAESCSRSDHVRHQIEQVLYTNPGDRVFRPEFGAGLRQLIFEPNATMLWKLVRKQLTSSLTEALYGEVDPRTLEVDIETPEDSSGAISEFLYVTIRYELTAIGRKEEHRLLASFENTNG